MSDAAEPEDSAYEDARAYIRKAQGQVAALRRALEQSMEQPGGMAWEEHLGAPTPAGPTPNPTAPTQALAETEWEAQRQEKLRQQLLKNWPEEQPPAKPRPFKRRPWRT